MILSKVFQQFVEKSPVPFMLRAGLEFALPPCRIDELFREHAQRQYEDELLFSSVVEVLSLAVCGVRKSVHAAYQAMADEFKVSVISLYNKLKKTETAVSQALVRESSGRFQPVVTALKAQLPPLVPGYRLKILDGNHLAGTQHRLKESRSLNSAPLPGQALVVLEPELMLITDVFPYEDAHAQERKILQQVLQTVQPDDLWLADRNFCTTEFLFGLRERKAYFLIRQHASTLYGKELLGERRRVGRTDTGAVFEQKLRIVNQKGHVLVLRRVTIELDQPTENGETEIHLLTNLPARIGAIHVADTYLHRWTIENAFQEIEQALQSEINTLCYPKAALLAFCVALLTYNVLSVIKAALRSKHGEAASLEKLSGYYLAEEISAIYGGMLVAIPSRMWTKTFAKLTPRQMANVLYEAAGHVNPRRFYKRVRGPKKPPPKRTGGLREKHVSTYRLLMQRTAEQSNK
jgi:IS4 transposase